MFCIECGTKIPDQSVFCSSCGAKQPTLVDGGWSYDDEPAEMQEKSTINVNDYNTPAQSEEDDFWDNFFDEEEDEGEVFFDEEEDEEEDFFDDVYDEEESAAPDNSIVIPKEIVECGGDTSQNWLKEHLDSNIVTVIIPDSATEIGGHAFSGCRHLTSINIPDSVTKIGKSAFSHCTSLISINIPDSVTEIGDNAFYNCRSLTSIHISDSVAVIDCLTFGFCNSLTSVSIPDSVTKIVGGAFAGCSALTNVSIPDSVFEMGGIAFSGCKSLKNIYIRDNSDKSCQVWQKWIENNRRMELKESNALDSHPYIASMKPAVPYKYAKYFNVYGILSQADNGVFALVNNDNGKPIFTIRNDTSRKTMGSWPTRYEYNDFIRGFGYYYVNSDNDKKSRIFLLYDREKTEYTEVHEPQDDSAYDIKIRKTYKEIYYRFISSDVSNEPVTIYSKCITKDYHDPIGSDSHDKFPPDNVELFIFEHYILLKVTNKNNKVTWTTHDTLSGSTKDTDDFPYSEFKPIVRRNLEKRISTILNHISLMNKNQ